jgi:hypothetical protein
MQNYLYYDREIDTGRTNWKEIKQILCDTYLWIILLSSLFSNFSTVRFFALINQESNQHVLKGY